MLAWPRRAASRHPRPDLARQGQEVEPGLGRRATPRPRLKDGTTHLAYKPEHAVDLDTGAVVAAELHPADEGDTDAGEDAGGGQGESRGGGRGTDGRRPGRCVTDKGYHSRSVLKALDDGPWKTRSEPKQKGFARWHGDGAARRAVTNNRTRLLSGVAKEAFKLRAEIVERSFAHNLDRGGMRRTWLRGRENVHKRYLPCRRPQSESPDAQTDRRRHPAGGRGGRIWLYLRAYCASWSRSGRSDGPHRLGGWRNRLRRVMFRRRVKPGQ